MNKTPLFLGLTKPVTFGGLPMMYVVVLILVSMGGFMATLSFVYLIVSAIFGYGALRALAAKDLRLMDVVLVVLQQTPLRKSQFEGKGVTYRA
ncbi:MAG: VirB3 family type IV secretion system protein [Pseudomonadota bacterium]